VDAYRTIKPEGEKDGIREMLQHGDIHMVTFTSSSTVINFLDMFQGEPVLEWMDKVAVACIGPITAESAEKKGLKVTLVAKEYTIPSLTQAIVDYFSSK